MKKLSFLLPALALMLLGAGCSSTTQTTTTAQTPPVTQPATVAQQPPPSPAANTVTYTDSGFSPAVLTVKVGTTVIFANNASDAMRVASNPHPIHNGYPTKGGCVGSTFDSCANIAPGTSWSFTFDIAGTWKYHNHLNPGEGGTIVVQNADGSVPTPENSLQVNEKDNKTTLHVTVGATVDVILHSTYWQLAVPNAKILMPLMSEPTVTPDFNGVAGSGLGTVEMRYKVVAAGTATIDASRVSCGEALRCTGDQGTFQTTIIAAK